MEFEINEPVPIFCENMITVKLCNTLKSTHKSNVINMRMINQRFIIIVFIPSILNVSEVLTNPLNYDDHFRHCNTLIIGNNGQSPMDNVKNREELLHTEEGAYLSINIEDSDRSSS